MIARIANYMVSIGCIANVILKIAYVEKLNHTTYVIIKVWYT